MSNSSNIQHMIDNSVNSIYPDVSEKGKVHPSDEIIRASYVEPIITDGYVVAGVELNTHEYKEKNSAGLWIIILMAAVILILIIVIIAYNYSGDGSSSDDDPVQDSCDYDTNVGAIIQDSEYYVAGVKMVKKMKKKYHLIKLGNEECDYGYYGEDCNLQAHSVRYYNAGTFDSTYKYETLSGEHPLSLNYSVKDGSKDRSSCTTACDLKMDCKGVLYDHEKHTCSLITSDVIANGDAVMDYAKTQQMYLKRNVLPQFTDLIVGFAGSKIMRYYLSGANYSSETTCKKNKNSKRKSKGAIIHFIPETVLVSTWTPYRIANFGGYVGLYSNVEFTIDNWQDTEMLYVDQNIGEYNIPLFLQEYTGLYILYITSSEFSSHS